MIRSQSFSVTTTTTYNSADPPVISKALTTINVSKTKQDWFEAYTTDEGLSKATMDSAIKSLETAAACEVAILSGSPILAPFLTIEAAAAAQAAVDFLTLSLSFEVLAQVDYTQAVDPPDPDYQVIPTSSLTIVLGSTH